MFNQLRDIGEQSSNSGILITKDLLGGLCCNSQESPPHIDFKGGEKERGYHEICKYKKEENGLQELEIYPQKMRMIEKSLELKLESSCSSSSSPPCSSSHHDQHHNNESVCTLEKVKNALQRERKRRSPPSSSLSSSSSSTGTGLMFAAGCPACLLYVITLETNPKCPRCNSIVSSSLLKKKPRLDLNAASAI